MDDSTTTAAPAPRTQEATTVTVAGLRLRYRAVGTGQPMLILHGWGSSIDAWGTVQAELAARGYATYALDLPGHGGSEEPPEPWGVDDFATLVRAFIAHLDLKHFVLLGHSNGGRVGIKLAHDRTAGLDRLVLTGAAGLRHPLTVKQRALVGATKIGKRVLDVPGLTRLTAPANRIARRAFGKRDYFRAEGVMRATLVRLVNEDLRPLLPTIAVPTLLVWGDADQMTPLSDGQEMARLIPGARLEVVPGGTHRLPYERPEEFVAIVARALEEGGRSPSLAR